MTERKTRKNIGLFGASFNPPHRGHLAVLNDILEKNIFDEVWLVPVCNHPFAKDLMPFDARLMMTKLLAQNLKNNKIRVSTIEMELNRSKSFAFDAVSALKEKYPRSHFTLIVGSDVKKDLRRWHRINELKKLASFHLIRRSPYTDSPYPEVSSTEIRALLAQGEPIDHLVPKNIAHHLKTMKLRKPRDRAWDKNIYLSGFMAAGKTSVGKILAKKLLRNFVDTDKLIEEKCGKSIAKIFGLYGESHFRTLERQVLKDLKLGNGLVVSLGGGIPLDTRNQNILKNGTWIFLDTPLHLIIKRLLRSSHRPVAKGIEQIKKLYHERLPTYQKAAHIIDCQDRDPDDICRKILKTVLLK